MQLVDGLVVYNSLICVCCIMMHAWFVQIDTCFGCLIPFFCFRIHQCKYVWYHVSAQCMQLVQLDNARWFVLMKRRGWMAWKNLTLLGTYLICMYSTVVSWRMVTWNSDKWHSRGKNERGKEIEPMNNTWIDPINNPKDGTVHWHWKAHRSAPPHSQHDTIRLRT